jgi:hypothetical protein
MKYQNLQTCHSGSTLCNPVWQEHIEMRHFQASWSSNIGQFLDPFAQRHINSLGVAYKLRVDMLWAKKTEEKTTKIPE